MNVFVFSDLHFFRGRNDYLTKTCEWLSIVIANSRPDLVVFCGDLNHSHSYVEVDTLHAMATAFETVAHAAKVVTGNPLFAISGNHDTALKDGGKNVIQALGNVSSNIMAITEPYIYDGLAFIPHPPTNKDAQKGFNALAQQAMSQANVMFSHVELADIRYTPASSHCTDHPFVVPDRIKLIVNGHYHHPEIRKTDARTTVIVGSPCYHSYADMMVGTPRGAVIIENVEKADQANISWLNNPYGPIYHTVETSQLAAIAAHESLSRMMLRVKVSDQRDYEANKPVIEQLRKTATSVRVIGSNPKASSEIYKAETSTIGITDPTDMISTYVKKAGLTKDHADFAAEILAEVTK